MSENQSTTPEDVTPEQTAGTEPQDPQKEFRRVLENIHVLIRRNPIANYEEAKEIAVCLKVVENLILQTKAE